MLALVQPRFGRSRDSHRRVVVHRIPFFETLIRQLQTCPLVSINAAVAPALNR